MLLPPSATFFYHVYFLGYVISKDGLAFDDSKVEALRKWPQPRITSEVRSFHDLASFIGVYCSFSSIMAPFTDCIKGSKFIWIPRQIRCFGKSNYS